MILEIIFVAISPLRTKCCTIIPRRGSRLPTRVWFCRTSAGVALAFTSALAGIRWAMGRAIRSAWISNVS